MDALMPWPQPGYTPLQRMIRALYANRLSLATLAICEPRVSTNRKMVVLSSEVRKLQAETCPCPGCAWAVTREEHIVEHKNKTMSAILRGRNLKTAHLRSILGPTLFSVSRVV